MSRRFPSHVALGSLLPATCDRRMCTTIPHGFLKSQSCNAHVRIALQHFGPAKPHLRASGAPAIDVVAARSASLPAPPAAVEGMPAVSPGAAPRMARRASRRRKVAAAAANTVKLEIAGCTTSCLYAPGNTQICVSRLASDGMAEAMQTSTAMSECRIARQQERSRDERQRKRTAIVA